MRRILQFGTSRFLQAHVDLFVHEAREDGQDVGPITVVKTTPPGVRDQRIRAFGRVEGYPVVIRGLADGRTVERRITVRSVVGGLSAYEDWDELRRCFVDETEIVVSNTGDAGYAVTAADYRQPAPDGIPESFPAKLLALLLARHVAGGRTLTILPCELISGNGRILSAALDDLAKRWSVTDAFRAWLNEGVVIADTLVDRIVSAPIEPIGAVAEPYALWAIQRRPGLSAPLRHPDVMMTDTLEPYERLKLHILNLGHSFLAELWSGQGHRADETVRGMLDDPAIRLRLTRLYETEVIPGFATRGLGAQAQLYVAATLERLANPFLDHCVADIWQNHAIKVDRRMRAFLDWADAWHGSPTLVRLVEAHRARLS